MNIEETADEKMRKKLKRWFQACVDGERTWRSNARMWHDYYHGDQLEKDVLLQMKERGQPPIKLNMIKSIVNLVTGQEIQGRSDIQFLGHEDGDNLKASVLTDIYRHQNSADDFDYEKTDSFRDGVIGGRGVMFEDWDSETKSIIRNYVDWEEVYIDQTSKRKDFSDARHMFRAKWLDLDVAAEMFEDKKEELKQLAGSELDDNTSEPTQQAKEYFDDDYDTASKFHDPGRKRLKIIEAWWKEADGTLWNAMFCDEILLSEPVKSSHTNEKDFPYIFFYYNRDRKRQPYGIVKDIVDPQNVINRMFSKSMHYLGTKQILAEEGKITDIGQLKQNACKADAVLPYFAPGSLRDKSVIFDENIQGAHIAFQNYETALNAMQRISGVNPELQGMQGNARSGTAISMRMRQGNTVLTDIYDCLEKTSKRIAKKYINLMAQYFDEEKLIRYKGDYAQTLAVRVNQPGIASTDAETGDTIPGALKNSLKDIFEYDITISEAAKSGNADEHIFGQLVELLKGMPQLGTPQFLAEVIKSTSLSNKDKLAGAIMPEPQTGDPQGTSMIQG